MDPLLLRLAVLLAAVAVSAGLAEFIGRVRPSDDRTMIVVKMREGESEY